MKTKTLKGTKVEIVGTCGCNHVIVKVDNRDKLAQVTASDLILPDGEIPVELSELKFHAKIVEPVEPVEPEGGKEITKESPANG